MYIRNVYAPPCKLLTRSGQEGRVPGPLCGHSGNFIIILAFPSPEKVISNGNTLVCPTSSTSSIRGLAPVPYLPYLLYTRRCSAAARLSRLATQ